MASTSDVINALKYTYGTEQVLYPSSILGTVSVSPLTMASAYTARVYTPNQNTSTFRLWCPERNFLRVFTGRFPSLLLKNLLICPEF